MWLWDVSIEVSSESLPRRPFDTLLEMLKNHCIVKHFPCRLLMSRSVFRNAFRSTWVNINVWKMPHSDPDDSRCQINRSFIGLRASVLRLIGRDFDSFAWQKSIWISSRQKTGHSCSFQIDVRLTSEWRPCLCSPQMCFVHRLFTVIYQALSFVDWFEEIRSALHQYSTSTLWRLIFQLILYWCCWMKLDDIKAQYIWGLLYMRKMGINNILRRRSGVSHLLDSVYLDPGDLGFKLYIDSRVS